MATGYDNRGGGRSSFAFEPAAPTQSRQSQGGGFRGVGLRGGETSIAGGIAAASQFTPAGGSAGPLGGLLDELLSPMLERRKKEQFVKGMVDQMSAVAGEEIRVNSKNPINKIFGPSAYEEGAIAFSVQDAVNKWQVKTMADKDNLKRLPPDQLTKVVAGTFDSMMTGDSFTDAAVQAALIEAVPPVVGAIAKERYKWQQFEARRSWEEAADSNGEAFQQQMVSLASNSEASEDAGIAANAAFNNFKTSLARPEGMDDETWKESLMGFYRKAAQEGRGYAVSALKEQGFLDILTDDERAKMEDAEARYADRAIGRAAMDPETARAFSELQLRSKDGTVPLSELYSMAQNINRRIRDKTGFDVDLIDYKEIKGVTGDAVSAMIATKNRNEDYQRQRELIIFRDEVDAAREQAQTQQTAAQVMALYASGHASEVALKVPGGDAALQALESQDFAAAEFGRMAANFRDGHVPSRVATQAQKWAQSYFGQEYSKDFEQGYARFEKAYATNPALAFAIWGDVAPAMMKFKSLRQNMNPTDAFRNAFGSNPEQYSRAGSGGAKAAGKANKEVREWIDSNEGGRWWSWFFTNANPLSFNGKGAVLNSSGKNAMAQAIESQLAVMSAADSSVSPKVLVPSLMERALNDGSAERYGALGWYNGQPMQPLYRMIGIRKEEAQSVVPAVIDTMLKRSGWKDGASSDEISVQRHIMNGEVILRVQAYDDEGTPSNAVSIPVSSFKAYHDQLIKETTKGYQPGRGPNRVMRKVIEQNKANVNRKNTGAPVTY